MKASSSSWTSLPAATSLFVTKLVAARAVGKRPAMLARGLAAGLGGEALREGAPGRLELAAMRAPRCL